MHVTPEWNTRLQKLGWDQLDLSHPNDLAVPIGDAPLFPVGAGLTRFLLKELADKPNAPPVMVLVWFTAEGDNMGDAMGLADAVNELLQIQGIFILFFKKTNLSRHSKNMGTSTFMVVHLRSRNPYERIILNLVKNNRFLGPLPVLVV